MQSRAYAPKIGQYVTVTVPTEVCDGCGRVLPHELTAECLTADCARCGVTVPVGELVELPADECGFCGACGQCGDAECDRGECVCLPCAVRSSKAGQPS